MRMSERIAAPFVLHLVKQMVDGEGWVSVQSGRSLPRRIWNCMVALAGVRLGWIDYEDLWFGVTWQGWEALVEAGMAQNDEVSFEDEGRLPAGAPDPVTSAWTAPTAPLPVGRGR